MIFELARTNFNFYQIHITWKKPKYFFIAPEISFIWFQSPNDNYCEYIFHYVQSFILSDRPLVLSSSNNFMKVLHLERSSLHHQTPSNGDDCCALIAYDDILPGCAL